MWKWLTLLVSVLLVACGNPSKPAADLVLVNGLVYTMDAERPQGQAVAVRGNTIVAVGSNEEIEALVGASTQRINLDGRMLFDEPGSGPASP